MPMNSLRQAVRQLKKSPSLTTIVILILALAIGANTTIFSVVDAVMLRPLPYAQPHQLMDVQRTNHGIVEQSAVSYPDFFDWRRRNHTFAHLVSYHDKTFTLTGVAQAAQLEGEVVSWDVLSMLGISPELGRGFTEEEESRGTRVALISHALWETHFGADKLVLGRSISLSGTPYVVIGVMPSSFRFPIDQPLNSLWTTLSVDAGDPGNGTPAAASRNLRWLNVIGRLKPGIGVAQADRELKGIAAQLATENRDPNQEQISARVQPYLAAVLGDTRTLLMVVLGAVMLVLLIACGNIANLLLVRVRERQRQIAILSALGASRGRIVWQLLAESLTLGVAGGLAGCGLAFLCTPAVIRFIPSSIPRAADAGVDLAVLGFAFLVSLAAGLIAGIFPAVTALRTDLVSTLKEGGNASISGHNWLRSAVIVGQTALGILLTTGAGLLITSFTNLTHRDPGFHSDHLLTFLFQLPNNQYKDKYPQFYRRYFEKLRALPGVEAAAGSRVLPMTNGNLMMGFESPEHLAVEGRKPRAQLTPVSTDYFRSMQVPLLKGRDFTDGDDMNSPQVMIVNKALVQKYFPGEDVVGKKLKPGADNGMPGGPPWREIIGVAGDVLHSSMQREPFPAIYLPASQLPNWCCLYSVVRTSLDPASLGPAVQQLVSSLDRDVPVTQMRTMRHLLSLQLLQPRFAMILAGSFAGLALILTVAGMYGVMTYSVSLRTREIGVRLALGAQRSTVLKMVFRDAAILLLTGMAIGLAATIAFASVLGTMLYGVGPRNPRVLMVVCTVVALAGGLATLLPALRAAAIETVEALRTD
jgi:predicted permease